MCRTDADVGKVEWQLWPGFDQIVGALVQCLAAGALARDVFASPLLLVFGGMIVGVGQVGSGVQALLLELADAVGCVKVRVPATMSVEL